MTRARLRIEDLRPHIEVQFDRSGGPGGQNVNKVNTRVTVLFDYLASPALSGRDRALIRRRLASRLSADGRLRVVSQESRSQSGNRDAAEARLLELLEEATHVEPPRRPTRPTAGSQRRRLTTKRRRGETKRLRGGGEGCD